MFNTSNPIATHIGNQPRWVRLRRDDGGKKIPLTTKNKVASISDPATWSTLDRVLHAIPIQARRSESECAALALVGDLIAVDWDQCLDRVWLNTDSPNAIMSWRPTYAEISLSRRGIHAYYVLTEPWTPPTHRLAGVEVYTSKRFMGITGWGVRLIEPRRIILDPTRPAPIATLDSAQADELMRVLGYQPPRPMQRVGRPCQFTKSDDEIITRLMRNTRYARLWRGEWKGLKPSASEADAALIHALISLGATPEQAERIWLASPAGQRQKVQDRVDYRQRTIAFVATKNRYETLRAAQLRAIACGLIGVNHESGNPNH